MMMMSNYSFNKKIIHYDEIIMWWKIKIKNKNKQYNYIIFYIINNNLHRKEDAKDARWRGHQRAASSCTPAR